MKQVNSKDKGCTPVSSNCVIWQGPCLECIDVNTGDSISDVLFELATVLCSLQVDFNLTNVDLDCLVTSGPEPEKTIDNILNLIITKLCSISPSPEPEPTAEVVVNIAACFQYTDLNGDLVTSMKVSDYAKAIGIKVCSLQTLVNQHTSTLANHEARITVLEQDEPEFVLPSITPVCVSAAVPTPIDEVLESLENQFCALRTVTGTPTVLSQAIVKQCTNLNTAQALSQAGTMSGITGWKTTVTTVADSLTNLWLTICDMRSAVSAVQTCCAADCSDITVNFIVVLTDNGATANIYFAGYTNIPAGFTNCAPGTSPLTITDGVGGSYVINVNLLTASASNDPIIVNFGSTPLAIGGSYSFTLASCLTNGTLTCNKTVIKTASTTSSVCVIPSDVTATIS